MTSIRTLTVLLAMLAMLGPFATDAYLPSFYAIGSEFDVAQPLVQQTLSAYLLAFACMSLFWGTLSDSFGRRPVIIASLVMFTVGSVGVALAPSFGWLLFFRIIQGCSAGAGRVVGQALVRDKFHGADAQRLFANITMVFSLAPAIAPIIGGYLSEQIGWRSVFWSLTAIALLLSTFCWRSLPETLPEKNRHPFRLGSILNNYFTAIRNPYFLLAVVGVGFAFAGFALYISSAANFIMEILKLPQTAFGWLFIPFIGGMFCGSMINSRFAGRFRLEIMTTVGLGVLYTGSLINVAYNLFFVPVIPWAVLPIFVYAFGMSLALPGMTIMTLNYFPRMRGTASSLQSSVQMLIFAIISGLVAPLLFQSALRLSLGMLTTSTLCLTLWTLSRWLTRRALASGKLQDFH